MKKLTDERFAAIPGLLAMGKTKQEIAEMFGVKTSTLQVQCCHKKISLRSLVNPRKKKKLGKLIRVSPEIVEAYKEQAAARGQRASEFVSELLSVIVRDNLMNAVLDEEVLP